MQITNLQVTKLEINDDVRSYLQERLDACGKLIPDDAQIVCDIELARTTRHHQQGDIYRAEANLVIDGAKHYAAAERETLHEAIDALKDELQRELRTSKRKRIERIKRGGLAVKNMMRGFTKYFRRGSRR